MKKSEAVKYFGSQSELAKVCGITKQAVSLWPGEHVPQEHQYALQILTKGQLTADQKERRAG